MTRQLLNRRAAGALTAALVLGTAGPAAARQVDLNAQGSMVPAATVPLYTPAHTQAFPQATADPVVTATPRAVVDRPSAGGSELLYVIIGGVVFAVGGLGGAFAAGRRRGTRTAARPRSTIAA